jgi:septal ring factor EnvC (AmiA/AmiB activator)
MERKYLLTESQLLSLREQTHCLTQQMQNMHAELAAVREELERTQAAHQMLEEEVVAMRRQAAVWTQREQQLEKVVALFLEQGAAVLRWTSLLEGQEGDELPPSLYMMREDMIFRRFDLEVSLREVSNYQRQLISPEQEESLSLGCESFLKYLGRDPNSSPPSPLSDSSNKENMDCSNRPCIRTSLPSRCKTAVKGQKG